MTLREIAAVLGAEILTGDMHMEAEPRCGFGSDLMSDVLTYATPEALLLTGLVNPQVIRTAEMADIVGILFVRGKHPPVETVQLALQVGIPLMRVDVTMFTATGRLFQAGLNGCDLRR
ncbi:MAG: DRTGG domain-containing protein [Anaerolineae bacterium]